jgi:hypothetical protein
MALGWNRTAPVSLAPLGMPGCFQHITADAAVLRIGQHGFARFSDAYEAVIGER